MDNMLTVAKNVILDTNTRQLLFKKNHLNLTEKEMRLFIVLVQRRGEVVSHADITETVWPERAAAISRNNILQLIFRLRKKLSTVGVEDSIQTINGLGYSFNIPTTNDHLKPISLQENPQPSKLFLSSILFCTLIIFITVLYLSAR
ncbi:winged helix-turn-helix domain-containing protein [Enterobacter bugandensis]|uniref:winged helix-turn-helix domain-containing protein n=1 Tax=Enterobacter bugandensis TaxID=881260 RepID=UPI000667D456|nr:winged helix-turn-helix domain-containing protein [Enterobacter bugandensis]